MRTNKQIADDYATLSVEQLFRRFYNALPISSDRFAVLYEETTALAKERAKEPEIVL